MKINACPKCGSRDILMGGITEGTLFGMTSWNIVCRDCNYQGMPVIFDSLKEYNKFLTDLLKEKEEEQKIKSKKDKKTSETVEKETSDLSKKEKEVVEFLNELAKEEPKNKNTTDQKDKPQKEKNWWFEIGLAIGISAVVVAVSIPGISILFGISLGLLYSILYFITLTCFILVAVVIIEYFLKSVKNVLKR